MIINVDQTPSKHVATVKVTMAAKGKNTFAGLVPMTTDIEH